jgi:hypothetical protein
MPSGSMQTAIRDLFEASMRAKQVFLDENAAALERAIGIVADALGGGRKLLLFGNGGSAPRATSRPSSSAASCASAGPSPSRSPPIPRR